MIGESGSAEPKIAVAIACFNQARFLEDAIQSICAQTVPAAEIILVDDGSTDDTAQIASRYPMVCYLRQANAGLSAARNAALAHAKSDRILFLDADDMLAPQTLQLASGRFRQNIGLAFVYGGYNQVNATRRHLSTHMPTEYPDAFQALLRGNHIAMHGSVVYDRQLLFQAGGFDRSLPSCEDYDVYLRLSRSHPIGAYDGVGAEYRRHDEAMSRHSLCMIETARRVIDRHAKGPSITPEYRRAAREGKTFMTRHYGDVIALELERARLGGWLRPTIIHLLRSGRAYPAALARVLPQVIGALLRQRG